MSESNESTPAARAIEALATSMQESFETHRRILSFPDFLEQVAEHPRRFSRSAAQYVLDALDHFGTSTLERGGQDVRRWSCFDAPFDGGRDKVVGNEAIQAEVIRHLRNFEREGRINRLLLLHGPNGSAKSSLVSCMMRALEAFSHADEGAIYRFNWIFPSSATEGGRIGFEKRGAESEERLDSFAYLEEGRIDARLAGEYNDNPLFLLPTEQRVAFLEERLAAAGETGFVLSDTIRHGQLGHRSRQVFEALLSSCRGDLRAVLRHVQVERFFISRRYREAAVTVEPQLRVDAAVRQLTADRSLAALPSALQNQTLFEVFGPLAEGNRGIIEYNDMLKRPMDANKYLLSTSEKGTVSLDTGILQLDAVLMATANETYLEAFKQQPDWSSYKGRIELVRMPYLLDYRAEEQIYDDLLEALALDKPVAPHTTHVLALWAVLTRLRRPAADGLDDAIRGVVADLQPLRKALLYADADLPAGLNGEQQNKLRAAIPDLAQKGAEGPHYEGRYGASPREMKQLLLSTAHGEGETLSPVRLLEALRHFIRDVSVYEWLRIEPDGSYHQPAAFIDQVREHYLDRVMREAREATGLVDEDEYLRVFQRYVQHAKHWLSGEKIDEPGSRASVPADERMLEEVEQALGREEEARSFRSGLIHRVAAFRIDHPDDEVELARIFPAFVDRLREDYYARKALEVKRQVEALLAITDRQDERAAEALDRGQREQADRMLECLCSRFGYVEATAREAMALLFQERLSELG
ncbi:MAG: serine protein kinase PrkA [Deltaproteobacteria bacterium]|nr:MAG: serine protein kinase PrkA [Deltaproteobacteria bacterium]